MKNANVVFTILSVLSILIVVGCSKRSPFFKAVAKNDTTKVKRLLSKGVQVNSKNVDGWMTLKQFSIVLDISFETYV